MADEEERKSTSPTEEMMDVDEDSAEDGEEEEEEEEEEDEEEEMEISMSSSPSAATSQGPIVLSLSASTHGPKGLFSFCTSQSYLFASAVFNYPL